MPSASVAEFLELARELRLLADADIVRLADGPETTELPTICQRLVATGQLTQYQADRVLTARGYSLGFGRYTILDELGDGTFRAIDRSAGTQVRLLRFADGTASGGRSSHPSVPVPLLSGSLGGEGYAVHRRPDGADLASLVADMGPMPALLAAEYTRQAAVGLAALHADTLVHGNLAPARMFVGPLVQASKPKADGSPRYRPGPTATVTIGDFGLPANGLTQPDDVFQLGGVLFHLLTGRNPGEASLSASRPDCPAELATLTKVMLALNAADRPTAAEVVTRLTDLVSPAGQPDSVPLGVGSHSALASANVTLAETEQVELVDEPPRLALAEGWAGHPAMVPPPAFIPPVWVPQAVASVDEYPSAEEPTPPRRASRSSADQSRRTIWLLMGAFLLLVVLGLLTWVAMFMVMNSTNKPKAAQPVVAEVS